MNEFKDRQHITYERRLQMTSGIQSRRAGTRFVSNASLPTHLRFAAVLLLLLLAFFSLVSSTPSDSLNRYVENYMTRRHIPSIAALRITDRGNSTHSAFWGYSNLKRKERPTGDTVYLIASISKLFTATAVTQLEERGQLDLDVDVGEVLPASFPAIRNPAFPSAPITVRQLLTHTSSVRDDMDRFLDSYDCCGRDPEVSLGAFVRQYFETRSGSYTRARPGKAYEYTNMGFGLLGVVVETLSGQSFEDYTRSEIFDPLGMEPASWLIEGLLASGQSLAMPYGWSDRKGSFVPYGQYTLSTAPDGGLRTSVGELGKFLHMLLNKGVGQSGKRVLKASTLRAMMRQATPVEDWQGLAFYQTEVAGAWGHGGADSGANTMLLVDPKAGEGLIVLSNGDDGIEGDYEMLERLWDDDW